MSHSREVRPLEDYQEIGHRWKSGNIWSLVILIGRGLDPRIEEKEEANAARLGRVARCGELDVQFSGYERDKEKTLDVREATKR